MSNNLLFLQKFPKFEAFDLEANIADGYFLAQLIRENPDNIICLFLAPLADEPDQQEPIIIGKVSANRIHEILEYCPHLDTKYSHVALCIWKPSISTVHAFIARNLRWCLHGEDEEGGKALNTLKEIAPFTQIIVTTPSQILDYQPVKINDSIPGLVQHIMIWQAWNNKKDIPFFDGFYSG